MLSPQQKQQTQQQQQTLLMVAQQQQNEQQNVVVSCQLTQQQFSPSSTPYCFTSTAYNGEQYLQQMPHVI